MWHHLWTLPELLIEQLIFHARVYHTNEPIEWNSHSKLISNKFQWIDQAWETAQRKCSYLRSLWSIIQRSELLKEASETTQWYWENWMYNLPQNVCKLCEYENTYEDDTRCYYSAEECHQNRTIKKIVKVNRDVCFIYHSQFKEKLIIVRFDCSSKK